MSNNPVKKNIFLLAIVQISNYAFPLITFPYLSRTLGPEGFGAIALAQSIILYMTSFVDFGFNLTSTRRISIFNKEKNYTRISEVFTDTLAAKIILLIVSFVITITLLLIFKQLHNIAFLVIVGYLSVIGSVLFPVWLFQGLQAMKGVVLTTTTAKLISLLLIFWLVKDKSDTAYAMLATSVGSFLSGIISLYYVYKLRKVKIVKIDVKRLKSLIGEAFPIFLTFIGSSIYTTLNSFVLSFFVPIYAIGIYSGADRIRAVSQSMLVPMQQAIYPHLSSEIHNKRKFIHKFKCYGIILVSVSICISLFLAFLSPQIIHLFLGHKFDNSFKVLMILSPLPAIVSLAILFGQWGLVNIGKGSVLSKIYLYCALCHLIYICISAYIWGIYGAAISVVITESLVTLCIVLNFFKEYKKWKLS